MTTSNPRHWTSVRLGDVAEIRARIGWRGLKASEYESAGAFLIAGKHIDGTKVRWDACDRLGWPRYQESPEIQLRVGDVVLSKDGTIGRTAHITKLPGPATINGTMMLVRPGERLTGAFLDHALNGPSFKRFVLERVSGSSVPHIFQRDMVQLVLQLPPLGEQRKIAAILSAVDDAIEATQAVIDQLQVVKKAMMAELLTRGLPGRHTRFKQTEIGEMPDAWALCSIDDLGHPGEPAVRTGPFGSSMKTRDFRPEGVKVLTIQSLGEGRILPDGLFFIDQAKAAQLDEYRVRDNDVVFSRVADIGRCAAISSNEAGWLISPNLSRIRLDRGKCDATFLMYLITLGESVARQVGAVAGNAGRPVISSTTLRAIRLPLPSLPEQQAIAAAGREVEERLAAEQEYLEGLRSGKRALMCVLLTGDVRVTADADEAAA